jgi:hypothetical protein
MLQAGGAGLFGLSVPRVLAAEAAAPPARPTAKSVIFLLLFGGPAQHETFDMKPDAPSDIRGPFKPIPSRTPGLLISDHLPRLAAVSDRYCVVRTMTHDFNDHSGGGHYIQTGHRWHIPIGGGFNPTPQDWPSIGSMVEYVDQHRPGGLERELPSYAVLPNTLGKLQEKGQYLRPGEHPGWLGRAYSPLTTAVEKRDLNDNPFWRDCSDDELTFQPLGQSGRGEITLDRLHSRGSLLAQLDRRRKALDLETGGVAFDRFRQRALSIVSSERTRTALEVTRETAKQRDRYGRHLFGQSCLVARRLVEAGVRFVTVHYDCCDGYSWDSHVHSDDVRDHLMPTFDQATAALISDLDERGLLKNTMVVALGEMGRTPKASARWGRNHWSTLFPALLAGGGVRGGSVYGTSDREGAFVQEDPVSPEDLAATILHAMGIDPELRVLDGQARPTPLVDGGKPVTGIFG